MAKVAFATDNSLPTGFTGFPCVLANTLYDITLSRAKAVALFWQIKSWDIVVNDNGGYPGGDGPFVFEAVVTNSDSPNLNPIITSEIQLIQNPGGFWALGLDNGPRYFFLAFSKKPGIDYDLGEDLVSMEPVLLLYDGTQGQVFADDYDEDSETFTFQGPGLTSNYDFTVSPNERWPYDGE